MSHIVVPNLHPSTCGIWLNPVKDRLYPTTPCCRARFVKDAVQANALICALCRKYYGIKHKSFWAGKSLNSPTLDAAVAHWLGYVVAKVKVEVKR